MYVKYEDKRVRELFEDLNDVQSSRNLMRKEIGAEMTRAVKKKFNQLIAFSNFSFLLQAKIGKIEPLEGREDGNYSVHLSANYRLIVAPDTNDFSAKALKRCDTFIIKGVVDYHGKGSKYNWLIP